MNDLIESRAAWLRERLGASGAKGFVFGLNGGSGGILAGILAKKACPDTLGLVLPCNARLRRDEDKIRALTAAQKFGISVKELDLTDVRLLFTERVQWSMPLNDAVIGNIAPRLRMLALYTAASAENRLVVSGLSRSDKYVGGFTKWGDLCGDLSPVSGLTNSEIADCLIELGFEERFVRALPSYGMFDDIHEKKSGVSYAAIDRYLFGGEVTDIERANIDRRHRETAHKRVFETEFEG